MNDSLGLEQQADIFKEEMGHFIDTIANPGGDAQGDEGFLFGAIVTQLAENPDADVVSLIESVKEEFGFKHDGVGTITLEGGIALDVEFFTLVELNVIKDIQIASESYAGAAHIFTKHDAVDAIFDGQRRLNIERLSQVSNSSDFAAPVRVAAKYLAESRQAFLDLARVVDNGSKRSLDSRVSRADIREAAAQYTNKDAPAFEPMPIESHLHAAKIFIDNGGVNEIFQNKKRMTPRDFKSIADNAQFNQEVRSAAS